MRVLVLQHIKIEDPGFIKDLMIKDGAKLTTLELDEGEKIPTDLSKFDAMFCMGGPMDTWMEKEYLWLVDEKKPIKEFVVPFFQCLRLIFYLRRLSFFPYFANTR